MGVVNHLTGAVCSITSDNIEQHLLLYCRQEIRKAQGLTSIQLVHHLHPRQKAGQGYEKKMKETY